MKRIGSVLACLVCLTATPAAAQAATGDLVVSIWRGSGAARNLDLALIRSDGVGTPRFLTRVGVDDHSPSWSPSGDRIVLARRGRERGGIYVLRGASTTRLTRGPLDAAPAFSPDGMRIAFSRHAQVMVMRADGRGVRLVTKTTFAPRQLSWSPDGRQLLYSDDGSLRRLEVATGSVARLEVSGLRPALSRDGSRIAYLASGGIGPYYRDLNWGIYVSEGDGASPSRVVDGQFGPLSWSPDGSRLLVTDGRTLALVDVAGRALERLPFAGSGGAFRP